MAKSVVLSSLSSFERVREETEHNVAMAKQGTRTTVHQVNSVLSTLSSYTGSVKGVKVSADRVEDRFQAAEVYNLCALNAKAATIAEYTASIDGLNSIDSETSIVAQLDTLLSEVKSAYDTAGSDAFTQTFLSRSTQLASAISSFAKQVEGLSNLVDTDMFANITKANEMILSLFTLNKEMAVSDAPQAYHDRRDELLNELSYMFDINVRYGAKGEGFVSLKSGITIVNNNIYTKLAYNIPDPEVHTGLPFNPIMGDVTATHMSGVTRTQVSDPIVLMSGNIPTKDSAIKEGALGGLGQLRQKIIPEFMGLLDSVATQISFAFNEQYNSGVRIPPESTLSSSRLVTAQDSRRWSGSVKIAALDDKGLPVMLTDTVGTKTALRPLTINLDQFSGTDGTGDIQVSDILQEINAYFQTTITTQRLTLGGLDNIVMVGNSAIRSTSPNSTSGEFSFQMELDNGSPFDATFNVLDVQVFDDAGALVANGLNGSLPDHFISTAGTYTRTGQNISINIPLDSAAVPGTPAQFVTIAVKMQVVKTDGTFGEGVATFTIPNPRAGQTQTNVRTYGVPSAGGGFGPSGGVSTAPAISSTGGALLAKLADDSGFSIGSQNTQGRVTISGTGYRVALDNLDSKDLGTYGVEGTGFNFGHYFGMNNFFVESDVNPALSMKVREDLAYNPQALSFSKLQQVPKETTTQLNIGQTAAVTSRATATLNLGAIAVGDTINIQGVPFIMVAGAPVLPTEIQFDAIPATTANNILAALQAYNATNKPFRDIVDFTLVGGNLVCTAKNAGIGGNGIGVNSNIVAAGGNTWTAAPVGGAVGPTLILDGGYSAQEIIKTTNYADQVGTGNREVFKAISDTLSKPLLFKATNVAPESYTTLSSYVNNLLTIIGTRCHDAEQMQETYLEIFNGANQKYQEFFKPNADRNIAELNEYMKVRDAMLRLVSFDRENFRALITALS